MSQAPHVTVDLADTRPPRRSELVIGIEGLLDQFLTSSEAAHVAEVRALQRDCAAMGQKLDAAAEKEAARIVALEECDARLRKIEDAHEQAMSNLCDEKRKGKRMARELQRVEVELAEARASVAGADGTAHVQEIAALTLELRTARKTIRNFEKAQSTMLIDRDQLKRVHLEAMEQRRECEYKMVRAMREEHEEELALQERVIAHLGSNEMDEALAAERGRTAELRAQIANAELTVHDLEMQSTNQSKRHMEERQKWGAALQRHQEISSELRSIVEAKSSALLSEKEIVKVLTQEKRGLYQLVDELKGQLPASPAEEEEERTLTTKRAQKRGKRKTASEKKQAIRKRATELDDRTAVLAARAREHPDELACCVCLESRDKPFCAPACGHVHCVGCLEGLKDQRCPVCRQDIQKELVRSLYG